MNKKERFLLKSGKNLINLYVKSLLDFDLKYEAELDNQPKIFAPNHPTTSDPFIISKITKIPFYMLITNQAFIVKGFGAYLRQSGHISVKKGSGGKIVEQALRKIEQGDSIAIFPEGRLSPIIGTPAPFRSGIGRISLSTNAPIIPIGIYCSDSNMLIFNVEQETGTAISRVVIGGKYFITVGKPIHVFGDPQNYEDVKQVNAQVREEVQRLMRLSEARSKEDVFRMPSLFKRFTNFLFGM